MKTTRRRVLQGSAAAASLATFGIRTRRSYGQSGVVRFVPHGDVRSLDPIWTTANMSAYHGAMVYDTLFGIDENLKTFHKRIVGKNVENETVEPSVLANLATILGREAAQTGKMVTWDEMIQTQRSVEPDLRGLTQ